MEVQKMLNLNLLNSMKTKNQMITEIYNKNYPMKAWHRKKDSTYEDYCQYMYLLLTEMPEDKLLTLYERGELDDYFYQMCWNQSLPNSKFFKDLYGKLETIELKEEYTEDDTSSEE